MDKCSVSLQMFPPVGDEGEAWRADALRFFASLPVALERSDVRLCHACWHAPSIERLRTFNGDILEAYRLRTCALFVSA
jgi:diadenosine tetraphosphatase ApaH/serine/threonine PP2A family protein phosphatase